MSNSNKVKTAQLRMVLKFFDRWEGSIIQKQNKMDDINYVSQDIQHWRDTLQNMKSRSQQSSDQLITTELNQNMRYQDQLSLRTEELDRREQKMQEKEGTIEVKEQQLQDQMEEIQKAWKYLQTTKVDEQQIYTSQFSSPNQPSELNIDSLMNSREKYVMLSDQYIY